MSIHPNGISRRAFLAAGSAAALATWQLPASAPSAGLRAAAAKADITLPIGASNGGVIARGGVARQVHDELCARCLVLDDGRTPLALVVCDLRMIDRQVIDRARSLAAAALGWPADNILVSATHTHAAPALLGGLHDQEIDRWYSQFVSLRIADAIRRAAANLAPVEIGCAAVDKPEHLFNRRWKVRPGTAPANPFGDRGEVVVMNPGRGDHLVEPAGPVDPELSVISVRHSDGRPLAVLANYGLHYVGGYAGGAVSADYFGIFAERLAALLPGQGASPPFVGIMSNGTSGDVNNHDLRSPPRTEPPWEKMRIVAEDLAQAAAALCARMEYRSDVELAVAARELDLAVRRPDQQRLEWAQATVAAIQNAGRLSRPQIYAQEALALAAYPERVSLRLQAIRIGRLGIAAVPCEVFAETGLEIKRASPLRPTMTIELANGYNGYLPTPRQHAWGGYETWPARSSYLEVDASTKIRDAVLTLLADVKDPPEQ